MAGVINPYWELIIQYACIFVIYCSGSEHHLRLHRPVLARPRRLLWHRRLHRGARDEDAVTETTRSASCGAIIVGGIVAGVVGFLIGLPILRLRLGLPRHRHAGLRRHRQGVLRQRRQLDPDDGRRPGHDRHPEAHQLPLGLRRPRSWRVILMRNLVYSSHGRAFLSIREDEIAANTMGVEHYQVQDCWPS